MQYRRLTDEQYFDRIRTVVVGAESLHAHAQNAGGDGMATIGYGYTFNRNNNVGIWRESGIELDRSQWTALTAIDAAPDAAKTRLGLAFTRVLNAGEADRLLRASIREYESPADRLELPLSEERMAIVSLAYNRGVAALQGNVRTGVPEHPVMNAIREGDRPEAWFQVRYNCWGSAEERFEGGLRKRRFAEATVFGLYDDPSNVSLDEAESVLRMHGLHRTEIDRVEGAFGTPLIGDGPGRNRIEEANRDYPGLTRQYGDVPTIAQALMPAHGTLISHLREQHQDLGDVGLDALPVGSVFLDPGRPMRDPDVIDRMAEGLRGQPRPPRLAAIEAVARELKNSSVGVVEDSYASSLDSGDMRARVDTRPSSVLLGKSGDDTLRGGPGADVMMGGDGQDLYEVDAGDVVKDTDGRGALLWGGQRWSAVSMTPSLVISVVRTTRTRTPSTERA